MGMQFPALQRLLPLGADQQSSENQADREGEIFGEKLKSKPAEHGAERDREDKKTQS